MSVKNAKQSDQKRKKNKSATRNNTSHPWATPLSVHGSSKMLKRPSGPPSLWMNWPRSSLMHAGCITHMDAHSKWFALQKIATQQVSWPHVKRFENKGGPTSAKWQPWTSVQHLHSVEAHPSHLGHWTATAHLTLPYLILSLNQSNVRDKNTKLNMTNLKPKL